MASNTPSMSQRWNTDNRPFGFTRVLAEGILAGMVGAATIAVWFLLVDTIAGHSLYTPSLLGSILFGTLPAGDALDTLPVSLQMVGAFTVAHGLVFTAIGITISWLFALTERYPFAGLAVLVPCLFVLLQLGFVITALTFRVLLFQALGWGVVLIGNGLAALTMGSYLWWRHGPRLKRRLTETFFAERT